MYLFLQNWRATLIPTITVPIVICGTFIVLHLLGMSINTLTLFALVLAIGLLVDDTIVVVENVERLIHEHDMDIKQACLASMQQITGALIGITLVLTAVFIPMSFFTGSTGVIYRQFSITLASSMLLSLLVAITITPSLCTLLLKKRKTHPRKPPQKWQIWVDKSMQNVAGFFSTCAQALIQYKWSSCIFIVFLSLVLTILYRALPTSFIPNEDQGLIAIQYSLQNSASLSQTQAIGRQINDYLLTQQKDNVNTVLVVNGQNFSGNGAHLGLVFVSLKHWNIRDSKHRTAFALRKSIQADLEKNLEAKVMVGLPPSVSGLGQSDAISLWLRDLNGQGRENLSKKFEQMESMSQHYKAFQHLSPLVPENKAEIFVNIDQNKVKIMDVESDVIRSTLATAWGGSDVNDFIERGRIKPIILQGDAPYRSKPEDLNQWHVRNRSGDMIPLSYFAESHWTGAPEVLNRFMGLPAIELEANVAAGYSSGQAMQEITALAQQQQEVDIAWSGLSLQELQSSHQAIYLYIASIAFIFLCLATLYESWKIPFIILLGLPLGIVGSIIVAWIFNLPNDVYFQIALLTGIGLSCKNAILIVEFASKNYLAHKNAVQAALQALTLRIRPILMTSLAFGAGIIPLALATGAGANSRYEIGMSILGSVVFGTILVPLFTVFLFTLIQTARRPALSIFSAKQKYADDQTSDPI